MSFLHHADILDGALAVEPDDLRRKIDAVGRPQEQQHRAAGAVGVDLKLHRVAGGVFPFVGHQFEVVEAELRAVETLADDREDVAAFDGVRLRFPSPKGRGEDSSVTLYEMRYWPAWEAVICC